MNQKKKIENYQQIAMGTGLRYDETNDLFHGERDGFDFIVYAPDARYPYMMVLHTAAKSADGSTFDKQAVKGFQKSSKKIASFGQKNLDIRVSLKAQSNAEKCKDTLNEALAATTTFLRTNSYSPCCDLCGQNVETGAFRMGSEYYHLCPRITKQSSISSRLRSTHGMPLHSSHRNRTKRCAAWRTTKKVPGTSDSGDFFMPTDCFVLCTLAILPSIRKRQNLRLG